jgi:hypothetical protein
MTIDTIINYGCQPCLSGANLEKASNEQWCDDDGNCNSKCPYYEKCGKNGLSESQKKEYAFFKRAGLLSVMGDKGMLLNCYPFVSLVLNNCPRKKTADRISQMLYEIDFKQGCSDSFAGDWENLKTYIIPAIKRNHANLEKMRFKGLFTHNHTSRIITTMNDILNMFVCWFCHKPEMALSAFNKKVHAAYEKFQPLLVLKKAFTKREKQTFLKIFYDDFEEAYQAIWFDREIKGYEEFWETGYSILKSILPKKKEKPEPNENPKVVGLIEGIWGDKPKPDLVLEDGPEEFPDSGFHNEAEDDDSQ